MQLAYRFLFARASVAMEHQPSMMAICYAAAMLCSAQALLIAPLMAALLIHRRVVWRSWHFAPLAAGCAVIALWRIGAQFIETPLPPLNAGAPTVWAITALLPVDVPLIGLALASVVGAVAALTAHFSAQPLDDTKMLNAAALTSLVIAALLPGTTAAWFLLPLAIIVVHAVGYGNRRSGLASVLVTGGWAFAIAGVPAAGTVAIITALFLLAVPRPHFAANDNHTWPNLANSGTNWVMRSLR